MTTDEKKPGIVYEENPIITYEGDHVALGPMQRHFVPILLPWMNDVEIMKGVRAIPPATLESEYKWYDSLGESRTDDVFAILAKEDGKYRYIGHTGLHRMDFFLGNGTTGTIIGDRSVHGKGIGTEAKLWLLHHAFHTLPLRIVLSSVKAFNGNSFGHLLKCGYKVVGVHKHHFPYNGGYVDKILFEVFPEDFNAIWEQYRKTKELPKLTDEQKQQMKDLIQ